MEFRGYTDGLKPRYRFLSDKAVIVQAWKKAHEYVRRHNWYSDNLDLDLSCINLEDLYLEIQKDFTQEKYSTYKPSPMRLVLAPKACSGWKLDEGDYKPPEGFALRPLAHLNVKDQVVSMMFLMCLANIIERRQGVALPVKKLACLTDVVSYGNRLITDASVRLEDDDDTSALDQSGASFLWGNSETYNRYYIDYQNFIARPKAVLKRFIGDRMGFSSRYYIVSLDLKRFYDRIDRDELFAKVRREVETAGVNDDKFMDAFRHMLEWRWDDRDCASAKEAGITNERCGIPQGLAAGGFLANIYLLSFDDEMKRIVDSGCFIEASASKFKILDYCRYVDDMRFVVEANTLGNDEDQFKEEFVGRIQSILSELCRGQEFSPGKINWEEACDVGAHDFVSFRMVESKVRTSGTMDERSACELIELNRALWSDAAMLEDDSNQHSNSILDGIRSPRSRTSIKADRIERFAVNNWRRAYRALEGMLPREPDNDSVYSGEMSLSVLNLLTDEFCEEILKRWAADPSKVRILRIALDLRPKKKYLAFVLDALLKMWSYGDCSRACAAYVLAELYRAGSIETGFAYANEESKHREEWLHYRKYLHEQVLRFSELDLPWYTANQVMLYSLLYDKGTNLSASNVVGTCDKIYRECFNLISGSALPDAANNLPTSTFILACKIANDESIAEKYRDAIRLSALLRREDARKCLAFLSLDISPIVSRLSYVVSETAGDASLPETQLGWKSLHDVVFSSTNPFENEIAIVRLGLALCEFLESRRVSSSSYYTLRDLKVRCSNWGALSNASADDCYLVIGENVADCESDSFSFMFKPEAWERGSFAKMAQIGRVLRAVAMTGDEYSAMRRQFLTIPCEEKSADLRRFFGVRSIWLKRRYGLYFDRVCLGGVHVAFSPWFSELLSALLAWPGSYVANRYKKLTFRGLKTELQSRLKDLAQFGSIDSNCSLIPVDVDISKFCKTEGAGQGKVNIAVVQTLRPNLNSLSNPKLWPSASERRKARRHLSDMFCMLEKTFEAHSTLMKKKESINLIVFPELSIYPQDITILERFADQKNCMIFCGLVYCQHPSISTKLINTGIWIIPQRRDGQERRIFIELPQGKANLAHLETDPRLVGYRPVQWIVRGVKYTKRATRRLWSMSASICYDATDIHLAAALRDHIDCYIVSAFNPDVGLFDTMAESWRYHMYGHTVLANTGVYGGSTIQAPYKESYERILAHSHGGNQAQILLATLDLRRFENQTPKARISAKKRKKKSKPVQKVKTSPAGYSGRKR